MKLKSLCLSLVIGLLFVSTACSPAAEPEPAPAPAAAPETPAPASSDPLTGNWSGDWGPSPADRNSVALELKWDGTALSGTVNPGPNAIQLINTSFDPATGAVRMEADAQGRGGPVHYTIEGKLDGSSMSGSWSHDAVKGDFKITRS